MPHMMSPRWETRDPADPASAQRLARELGVSALLANLLTARNLSDPDEAEHFLHPRLASLPDPLATPGIEKAARRIATALERKETVVLYGDYDVDGVTSLAILHRFLSAVGLEAACFLPLREAEGYGLSHEGLDRVFAAHRPDLLVALDCGTSSHEESAWLASRGVDLVIIDHHEPKNGAAPCAAMVNPKVAGGNTDLCTAALVFKLCHGIQKITGRREPDLRDFLDLAAMGTICDLAPLRGENRVIVRHGLSRLSQTRWTGLVALMEVSSVVPPVSTAEVGFRLGPRLNAAGRLHTAEAALQLLLTDDPREAHRLALDLDVCNRERKDLEQQVLEAALADLEKYFDPARDCAVIAGGDGWHAGVVGIVASRLSRKYHRPAIVVGFDQDGNGHGSGRSIDGLSLVEALGECAELLGPFGGHHMAAGLSVHRADFEKFRKLFGTAAASRLQAGDLVPRLTLDARIDVSELEHAHLEELSLLEPCGMANPAPVFYARAVAPVHGPDVLKEKHVRFRVRGRDELLAAIWFNGATDEFPRAPWDVAFKLVRNEYRQRVSMQLEVQHLRSAAS
ncbi:MAG: single-stranded-DNA-specific exonuclease RecJ [Chthoniobacterales bacterium]|nr:single-stranded-DNA-specific exonuclease RecJ [Chthoniobacterales bacterium]